MKLRRLFRDKVFFTVVAAGLLLVVAAILVFPMFVYPFREDVFSDPAFKAVAVPVTDAEPLELQVARGGQGATVVLYFMGNVGSLAYFRPMLEHHVETGRTVVAMTYRGGGGVPGRPSEAVLKRDALVAADYVRQSYPDAPLVVQGYSLGTGLAVHVAARRAVSGVVLTSPFDAICRVIRRRISLPACILPLQHWRTDHDVAQLRAPVLIQHGTADRIVPYVHGTRLAGLIADAGVRVTFEALQGVGHTDQMGSPDYLSNIDRFIAQAALN